MTRCSGKLCGKLFSVWSWRRKCWPAVCISDAWIAMLSAWRMCLDFSMDRCHSGTCGCLKEDVTGHWLWPSSEKLLLHFLILVSLSVSRTFDTCFPHFFCSVAGPEPNLVSTGLSKHFLHMVHMFRLFYPFAIRSPFFLHVSLCFSCHFESLERGRATELDGHQIHGAAMTLRCPCRRVQRVMSSSYACEDGGHAE